MKGSLCIVSLFVALALDAQTIGGVTMNVSGSTDPFAQVEAYFHNKRITLVKADSSGRFQIEFFLPAVNYNPNAEVFFSKKGRNDAYIAIYPPEQRKIKSKEIYFVVGEIQVLLAPEDSVQRRAPNERWGNDLRGNIRWSEEKKVFYYHDKLTKAKPVGEKRPIFVMTGKVTGNGKPIPGTLIEAVGLGDRFIYKSSATGAYSVKVMVKSYKSSKFQNVQNMGNAANVYTITFKAEGYYDKQILFFPYIKDKTERDSFSYELLIRMIPKVSKWSNNDYIMRWNSAKQEFDTLGMQTKNKATGSIDSIPLKKKLILHHVLFETNNSRLLVSSYEELNRLANYLNSNLSTRVEIHGHTDSIGNDAENKSLSEARAKAVADYLIARGVDKRRVSYKGFGGSVPLVSNKTEQGRKGNRRVEFVILDK